MGAALQVADLSARTQAALWLPACLRLERSAADAELRSQS